MPGLASLFFLTAFVAVYCLLLAGVSIPFLLGMAESPVWLATWIVRLRLVRR